MEILHVTKKGSMMNTFERFDIYTYICMYTMEQNLTIKSMINAR